MNHKAIVIEHGGGLNKHSWYVWEVTKQQRINSRRNDWHRTLIDSGMRHELDDCYDAIAECGKRIRVTTIYS